MGRSGIEVVSTMRCEVPNELNRSICDPRSLTGITKDQMAYFFNYQFARTAFHIIV
jgi:hypothetical protein